MIFPITDALFERGKGGFWVRDDGTPEPVDHTSHYDFVRRYFPDYDDYNGEDNLYTHAAKQGWVHISHPGRSGVIDYRTDEVSI
jgi:hypothetical protein